MAIEKIDFSNNSLTIETWADKTNEIIDEINAQNTYVNAVYAQNTYVNTLVGQETSANNILTKIKSVDGAGSGLDADLIDGKHLSELWHVDNFDPEDKADLDSPAFIGTPTAPTPDTEDSSTKIATTAHVKAAIDALIAGAPGALDTLKELAQALGEDPNFATTVTNALAGKLDKSGGTMTGGLSFGSSAVSSATDLTRHIALFGTQYGFTVTVSNLNYTSAHSHSFYSGTNLRGKLDNDGNWTVSGKVTVGAGPTADMDVATKQYVDAIIERGSNANGEYVRWADGTQICVKRMSFPGPVSTANGYILTSSLKDLGSWPAAFVASPYRSVFHRGAFGLYSGDVPTETSAGAVQFWRPTSASSIGVPDVDVIGIGRWF